MTDFIKLINTDRLEESIDICQSTEQLIVLFLQYLTYMKVYFYDG